MGTSEDARLLVDYLIAEGVSKHDSVKTGWPHIGAVALDAALQKRNHYERTVRPRIEKFIAEHPDAGTTTGFLALAAKSNLTEILNYNSTDRMTTAVKIAEVFRDNTIETFDDLQRALTNAARREAVRTQLYDVKFVGDKTVGYIDILAGLDTGTAVDSRVLTVFAAAGISSPDYAHSEAIIREAAAILEWPVGGLDAVLWRLGEAVPQD